MVDVVQRQKDLGIDIPNDGEYGHTMSSSVDYGAWWNYSFSRLGGLEPTDVDRWADAKVHRSSPGHIVLTSFPDRRDRQKFNDAYNDPSSGILAHRKSRHAAQDRRAADATRARTSWPRTSPT